MRLTTLTLAAAALLLPAAAHATLSPIAADTHPDVTETRAPSTPAPGQGRAAEVADELDAFERDRHAILAMAGEYDVEFNFRETFACQEGYELMEPYHANATEWVEIIRDTGDVIELQHILVVTTGEGESHVVKHWRQLWTYQDTSLWEFRGHNTWERVELSETDVEGQWSQAVFQVDDSPRYEATGTWAHVGETSSWSGTTWRPLPRREATTRNDYDVQAITNVHTITPAGWVQTQHTQKLVVDDQHQPVSVIAFEEGVNTYFHTDEADFSAGREYWQLTEAYWADVRDAWDNALDEHDAITLRNSVDGLSLYMHLFGLADDATAEGTYDDSFEPEIATTIERFLEPETESAAANPTN